MSEYAWFDAGEGRQVFRKVPRRFERAVSSLACPMLIRDTIEPVRSMADGRMYDSMRELRKTYRADGNPQGEEYTEIGDAPMKGPQPLKRPSKAELSDLLEKVEAQIDRGEVPQTEVVDP